MRRERELASENPRGCVGRTRSLQGARGDNRPLAGSGEDMLKGRIETSGRQARRSSSSTSTSGTPSKKGSNDPEDPNGEAKRKLNGAEQMRELGLQPRLAAAVVGVSPSTVRRWVVARRRGQLAAPSSLRSGSRHPRCSAGAKGRRARARHARPDAGRSVARAEHGPVSALARPPPSSEPNKPRWSVSVRRRARASWLYHAGDRPRLRPGCTYGPRKAGASRW